MRFPRANRPAGAVADERRPAVHWTERRPAAHAPSADSQLDRGRPSRCAFLAASACSGPISAPPATGHSALQATPPTSDVQALPSAFARSICEPKLASDLTQTLGLTALVPASATWRDHFYACTYSLPIGQLVVSVKQPVNSAAARTYFEDLRRHLDRPETVSGLSSLGLPAFRTPAGQTVYLQGAETLEADASGLPPEVGVYGQTRNALADEIAIRISSQTHRPLPSAAHGPASRPCAAPPCRSVEQLRAESPPPRLGAAAVLLAPPVATTMVAALLPSGEGLGRRPVARDSASMTRSSSPRSRRTPRHSEH